MYVGNLPQANTGFLHIHEYAYYMAANRFVNLRKPNGNDMETVTNGYERFAKGSFELVRYPGYIRGRHFGCRGALSNFDAQDSHAHNQLRERNGSKNDFNRSQPFANGND
ncbi:hypothetical protein C8J57DRAFT_1233625 [Mycena rebaudengoi]|nr:hypothetical protein C8J57DRAFT_1233625 [Mycena rebaudengoi]